MTNRRMIGLRLSDDELASFNRYLQAKGYDSLSDFAHSLIQGRFTREELIQTMKQAMDVNNGLQVDTFPIAQSETSLTKNRKCEGWDLNPRTPKGRDFSECLLVL